MGMMGVFKWLRKDIGYRDRNGRSLSARQCSLSNESYRNALQAFIDRRRFSTTVLETTSRSNTDVNNISLVTDRSNDDECVIKNETSWIRQTNEFVILDVPRVLASEIFEIGWVAGTEDRYLELVYAEWENTRISLKRHAHPDCRNAVKADMEVLTKIRHPNVLMLMAMTQTEDHGLVSILEPIDCTLYNYMHEQGERISVREIARFAGKLADALRHAYMRGYVHSAISSHCVYLASGETVKLGGWELAVCMINPKPKPKREYEERLRTEIFRWQAPELFIGQASKESDIYGLALLIWEMCTKRIPWSDYSMSDLEKQYTQAKRGIALNFHDFPLTIYHLLEVGLQLDITKRNIDINRIRRLLQNLEIQHEYKDPIYANELASNNNEIAKTFVVPIAETITPTNYRNVGSQTSEFAKQRIYPSSDTTSISMDTCDSEIVAIARSTSISHLTHNDRSDLCDLKEKKLHSVDKQRRKLNVPHSVKKNVYKTNSTTSGLSSNTSKNSEHIQKYVPWNCTYRKVKAPKNLFESDYSSVSPVSSRLTDSIDDEILAGSARKNIQRLKEALASRRERFFYGTDSSIQDPSPRAEKKLLSEVKSKDYEPHKPASHKTSLEPKYNKSPGQYDSSYRSTQANRKVPYSQMPAQVKNAIIQPRVLNTDPQNFFESSLWKKEKEICISKMRKEDKDETQTSNEAVDVSMPLDVPERDETFTVHFKLSETVDTRESHQNDRIHTESITESDRRHSGSSNSLQVLKDALDRATEIICSTSPNNDKITSCIPVQSCDNFNNTTWNRETDKSIFEKIYSLTSQDAADEIRSIERTDNMNETFSLIDNVTTDMEMLEKDVRDCKIGPNESTFTRECTNISVRSSVVNKCLETYKFEEPLQDTNKRESKEDCYLNKFFAPTDETHDFELHVPVNIPLLLSQDKNCKTCNNKITLPRRRSLPAALCHLKVSNNSTLGKLPIRKADNNADSTIEDFYIDDDDLEMMNLNINMLLNEELTFDNLLFDDQTT